MSLRMTGCIAFALSVSLTSALQSADWPQILGPGRNGVAQDELLPDNWPAGGPSVRWQIPVGSGFSGVAVAGKQAVLFHRVNGQEEVRLLDIANGNKIWASSAPTTYRASIVEDDGPRCVPLIHGDTVIVHGAQGLLRCLSLKDGEKLWERDTHADFQAPEGYFGAGSSPIVEGDKVIVNVGGRKENSGIVAFSLKTGETVWRQTSEAAGYSSPVSVTIGDLRHLIVITRMTAISLDPANGKVRFQIPFGKRGPTVNGASPTVFDDKLFLTSSYGVGAVFGTIRPELLQIHWESDDILSSQYTTCIEMDGLLYGIHGRQDAGNAALRCIDPKAKAVVWEQADFGYATLIRAGDKLLILKTDGELLLATAGAAYEELARAKLFDNETRALPALANGDLYARDSQVLKCVEVRKGK